MDCLSTDFTLFLANELFLGFSHFCEGDFGEGAWDVLKMSNRSLSSNMKLSKSSEPRLWVFFFLRAFYKMIWFSEAGCGRSGSGDFELFLLLPRDGCREGCREGRGAVF